MRWMIDSGYFSGFYVFHRLREWLKPLSNTNKRRNHNEKSHGIEFSAENYTNTSNTQCVQKYVDTP